MNLSHISMASITVTSCFVIWKYTWGHWCLKVRSHMSGADAGGGGQKIGFNTNHYMRSHISCRGAGAKSAPQEMGPTPNFRRLLRNRTLQTIFGLRKWQIHPCLLCVCMNIRAVAERECLNPPVSAPQQLRTYVNIALVRYLRHG